MEYQQIEYKSIINKLKYIDTWFWCRYTLNPYRGCKHCCIYCDARRNKYNVKEFDNLVGIKTDADKVLDKRIINARTLLPDIVSFGGVCDAYQPIEEKFKITRSVLSILIKHNWPCFLLTKSDLILRDIDLLKELSNNSYLCIAFTINTTSDSSAKYFEPFSPSPTKRFEAIAKLKSEGLYVGICLMPVLPYIWDSEEQLDNLFKKAKEVNADFILFSSLSLGESMKNYLYSLLDQYKYGLSKKYKDIFIKGSYGPKKSYLLKLNKLIVRLSEKYNISLRVKNHYIPNDFRKNNYLLAHHLADIAYYKQINNKTFSSYQWAALNILNIKEDAQSLMLQGKLKNIRNYENDEIFNTAKDFLLKLK
ncbi:MAG: hypothetical protein KAT68_01525 [Bacteroidales bacterium]|nr:hypothetical protein [Bacteroidales bacterium]